MRKRIIYVLNWEKYQARSDKELPWCKLWGALFKRPWFQELDDDEKFCTISILDLARQFNNRMTEEYLFKGYLKRNYGLFMTEERVFKLCKCLHSNGFLSDSVVGLEGDKIRQDKIRQEESDEKRPPPSINTFDLFYSKYPRRVAKPRALKAWLSLKPNDELVQVILGSLEKQIPLWKDPQFIPHPATWLNQRRWEDELKTNVSNSISERISRLTKKEKENGTVSVLAAN
jgi:hypothetical protein